MRSIRCVGFDLDYTLAQVKERPVTAWLLYELPIPWQFDDANRGRLHGCCMKGLAAAPLAG